MNLPPEAVSAARTCLDAPALARVFSRPADGAAVEVWRERAFEIILDDAWVTGVFDRVLVWRDAAARFCRVEVFDFKTDRVAAGPRALADAIDRHAHQMMFYRRAAAILAGVSVENVESALVFTATAGVDGPHVVQ
jgi:hypothetical protein